MRIPPEVREVARQQQAVVTRRQALAGGMSRASVEQRLASGEWLRLHPGVYVMGGRPDPGPEVRLVAAYLAVPSGVVSHRSAAWVWGMLDELPAQVEVSVGRAGSRRPRRGVRVRSSRDGAFRAAVRRRGVLVTNPLRTLVDLASVAETAELGAALDSALRQKLVGGEAVLAEIGRRSRSGVRGTEALRRALGDRGFPGVETSALERALLEVVRACGLPEPAREHPVGPGGRYRADAAWVRACLIVEVDGFNVHGTAEALQADLARQNSLVEQGWRVLRYSWADLRDRPWQVGAEISRMLEGPGILGDDFTGYSRKIVTQKSKGNPEVPPTAAQGGGEAPT